MCYKYLYDIKVIIITPLLNTSKCNLTFKCRINCPKSFNRNKKSEIKNNTGSISIKIRERDSEK